MSSRIWLGILFLTLGLGFLLQQAGILQFTTVLSTWWPLILIIIGIIQLLNRTQGSSISGFFFIIVGGLFLANQWFDVNIATYIWPIILIFIGFVFIFARVNQEKSIDSSQAVNAFVIFSGVDVRSQSEDFQGGSVTAVFGGAEIDLRDVILSDQGATLDLSAIFGGVSITVPDNVQVEVKGIPIFGGWEDKSRKHVDNGEFQPVLKVNCLAVFGGVEIKD
ncbi:LiaI-LiaF-like domain-containing protein [Pseudogracilibacillus auburnensis]|uniref:Putative membrane protein n=1 Tax=Pseudogracilibacillus auburnensis TaxID=1494959 RepID=A0A2V3VGP2_9BACI|nr:DUF5668 domain-containing protein [Pseudogracilibacillus auburnensis]MBO1002446.1 hypothetical protein [Pseudogracilibacillus auburnensis]PXW80927.1 putative membrane protein [Pseudogracilibacillus auburnensis]